MPTKGEISVPNIDATETVKAHCVNRCYGLLQQKSETANETIEVINHYQQFLGDKAQKFVEAVQVIAAKQKNKGSLFAFEQHNPESRWVAFGRKPNTKDRLFYAPIEQKEAILAADAY